MTKSKFAAYLAATVFLVLGLSLSLQSFLRAWTEPTNPPPEGGGSFLAAPPSCSGANDALRWDGSAWICGTVTAAASPSGAVMAFNLADCPVGWTLADGSGGNPDLQGRFIRGLDTRNLGAVDPDAPRALASIQDDEIGSHTHVLKIGQSSGSNSDGLNNTGWNVSTYSNDQEGNNNISSSNGTETRPKNVALIYCVKD